MNKKRRTIILLNLFLIVLAITCKISDDTDVNSNKDSCYSDCILLDSSNEDTCKDFCKGE